MLTMLCVSLSVSSCTHSPTGERSLAFNNPDNEEKIRSLQSKLLADKDNAEGRMKLGKIFLSENMPEQAIGEFEKVLSFDSNNIQAYLLLSLAYQKLPKPDLSKAAKLLENATKLSPDNADVHLNLAQIYNNLKEDTKAINEFNRTIELSDDEATLVSAHLGLMAVYKRRDELEKAQEEYNSAYRIFPGVEEMIKQAEIDRITPAPRYVGGEFREDTGTHPSLETRIERAQQEVTKIKGEKNE
jgi:tetratricopeptide (TPR) repeat protein